MMAGEPCKKTVVFFRRQHGGDSSEYVQGLALPLPNGAEMQEQQLQMQIPRRDEHRAPNVPSTSTAPAARRFAVGSMSYRIYFGKDGPAFVILLGGGTKKRQSRDIRNAIDAWTDYKRRKR